MADTDRILAELIAQVRNRYLGKYRGTVADNADPQKLGRIRASVPEVLGDTDSGWALPCLPFGGKNEGQFTIPAVGAGVWIEFESGDTARPIWSGCWWAADDVPKDADGTTVTQDTKILRSEKGLMVTLDDKKEKIMVCDADGSNAITIESKDGTVTITAATKVIVDAPKIELVDGAQHPLVFGDDLVDYLSQCVMTFNTHMHAGETVMGIPVTPAPPASPMNSPTQSLLSKKVKTD